MAKRNNNDFKMHSTAACDNAPVYTRGNSDGVLLLHGFTGGPHEMKLFGQKFAEEGYSISIPLLPGHGTSVEDLITCRWYEWFQKAKEALFDLRKHCERIIVIGQSMGGTLGLHLAAHYQLEGVSAIAPGMFFKEKKTRLLRLVAPFRKYRKKKNGPDIRDDAVRERVRYCSYEKTPIKAALQLKYLFEHVKMDLPEIHCPVLIIHSTQDHVIDYKSSEYIYDKISSEHKQILTLNDSYHVLTLDLENKIVYRETNKFVKQILDSC